MRIRTTARAAVLIGCGAIATAVLGFASATHAQAPAPAAQPGIIDLATESGVRQLKGQWRYSDVKIIEVSSAATDATIAGWSAETMKGGGGFRPAAPGPARMTYDIQPKAGAAGFDDSAWPVIPAESIPEYRSGGQLCFGWYRINLTMPETAGGVATTGAKAFLNVNVDDYGEVWVNGKLPRSLRTQSPHAITGWNMTSHVPLTDSVKPGEQFQIAIFAINGPLSDTPTNRLFLRSVKLEIAR